MANRSPTIIDRADEVDTDLVPEPWDDRDAAEDQEIVTRRERYRLQGVTDGQGAGIVPAYNLNVADTGSIPSKTKDGWTRGSAGRVLNAQGQYVSRGSDVPRKSFDGEEPGLLVEAAGRTNVVEESSNIDPSSTNWFKRSGATVNLVSSIIDGENAAKVDANGDASAGVEQDNTGSYSGSEEVAYCIMEKGSSGSSRIIIFDLNTPAQVADALYDWGQGSITSSAGIEANARTLTQNGPNGSEVVKLQVRYDSSGLGGNLREFRFQPDRGDGSGNTILHHAQLEKAPNASSPIVTGGSPTTRSGDDYAIFEGGQPSWWNPNEGTLLADFTPKIYKNSSLENEPYLFSEPDWFIQAQINSNANTYRFSDDNIDLRVGNVSPFSSTTVGISSEGSTLAFSADGSSATGNTTGNFIGSSQLFIGELSRLIGSFSKVVYLPRALPESTLNAITS